MMKNKELIYPKHDFQVLYHNVVGEDGVLWRADPSVQREVGEVDDV